MIKIKIKTESAAFGNGEYGRETARILREIAKDIERGGVPCQAYRDTDGNTVATVSMAKR